MKKTQLEKRIEVEAEQQFDQEINAVREYVDRNTLLRRLKITVVYEYNGEKKTQEYSLGQIVGDIHRYEHVYTNFKKEKENRIGEIESEKTKKILGRLDELSYLFNNER